MAADKKISELPSASTLTGAEIFPFVQGGVTVQGLLSALAAFIGGSSIISKTEAAWTADATVYSNTLLVTADAFYSGGFQKFKLADGVSAWSALPYAPIGITPTFAQVLAAGNLMSSDGIILSPDGTSGLLQHFDSGLNYLFSNTFGQSSIQADQNRNYSDHYNPLSTQGGYHEITTSWYKILHTGTIELNGSQVKVTNGTASKMLRLNASKNLVASSYDESDFQLRSEKGAANGYAPLDGSAKISSTYLPAYVDDVIEVANYAALPVTGTAGVIYVTLDTNLEYRWSGSAYINIAKGDVQSVNSLTGAVVLNQDSILDGTTYKQYSQTEKTKLAGIATGATANSSDATLLNRANHTGTQLAATISDFASAVSSLGYLLASTAASTYQTLASFASDVRGVVLTGLSTVTSTAITATDSILVALGKAQAQINTNTTNITTNTTNIALKADKVAVSAATKTKITYNNQGVITAGADATTADIADSLNKRYQTDNQQAYNDATSSIQTQLNGKQPTGTYATGTGTATGTNTGDETTARINALYGYTPADASIVSGHTTSIAANTSAIALKQDADAAIDLAVINSMRNFYNY